MMNTKQKIIIVISILFMLVLSPTINANIDGPLDSSFDGSIYEYNTDGPVLAIDYAYEEPIGVVNAGGPYENVLGIITHFSGSFLSSYFPNVTGYTWIFGDGTSTFYGFDPIIPAESNITVSCPAGHMYNAFDTYTATLIIHYDESDVAPPSDFSSGSLPTKITPLIEEYDQDSAEVSIVSAYDCNQ